MFLKEKAIIDSKQISFAINTITKKRRMRKKTKMKMKNKGLKK